MENFNDLMFNPHELSKCKGYEDGKRAEIHFENGYGVSVVFGKQWYSNGVDTYEVAIIKGDQICYTTGLTDDVFGYKTEKEVTEIMKQVQELK
jgi:hypothetical protein